MTPSVGSRAVGEAAFLEGGGELGALIRGHDWSRTPLGMPSRWPQSLRSAVSIMLPSKAQIAMCWGAELIFLYNDAYAPVLGDKHPWALGKPIRDVWSELWGTGLREMFEGVLRTGEAFWAKDHPFAMQRRGFTEETYFDVSYDPIRDESGGVAGLFCIVSDTTGRVIGERRLGLLRDLGRTASDARSVADVFRHAGRVLAAYPRDVAFAAFLDAGGTPVSAVRFDREVAWPVAAAQTAPVVLEGRDLASVGPLAGGEWPEPCRAVMILPVATAGQAPHGFLVAGASPRRPFDEAYGDFLRLVASSLAAAVSAAHALEEQRAQAEALAEIDRAKTAFFSNVSHEFRTPLTLILGPLEDLLARGAPGDELQVVHRNALRLLRLVNALLDFSRIEAGRVRACYDPTDLATLTAELASSFRSTCDRAGLRLVIDCRPLPEPVYVDRDMWEKIVLNLLSNAFKFTLEGEIAVRLDVHHGDALLTVRDTGVGIPAEELPRMFERFHRVPRTQGRTHEGTGIGLALVRELAALHGGDVGVTSVLGEGSAFTVRVPFGSAHLDPAHVGVRTDQVSTATGASAFVEEALRWLPEATGLAADVVECDLPADATLDGWRPRVVWADDNADMRAYVSRLLGAHFEVEAVGDGQAALDAARREPPDVVLSDVMMPRLDGVGLLRALRADPATADVPVILLSARAGEESRIEGAHAGADDYVVKPFGARELLARVGVHARMARVRREAAEARRQGEERLRVFADTAPAMLWVTEPDGACSFLSRGWYEYTGQTEPQGLGFGWTEAVHDEDRPRARQVFLDANRDRVPFSIEYRLHRADGEFRWAIDAGRPRFDAGGAFLGYVGSVIDVHEHKVAEQVVRESEERFRALTSATSDVVYRMSPDWTEMRHLQGREFIADTLEPSRTWLDKYIHPDDQPHVTRVIEHAIRTKSVFELEHRVIRTDGTLGWTHSRAIPILDARGEITDWFGAASDVTRRKEAEAALIRADRAKDEFIATLSHELRNPLAPLTNGLQIMRLAGVDGPLAAPLEMMERQVRHLVRLVDDLLEMSRITRGSLELRRERVAVSTIVRNAVETVEPLVRAGGHRLLVRLPDEPLHLDGDPVRLAQILANLLNNAAKFTDPGGVIELRARREQGDVALSVRDDGVGIATGQLARVFEMFSRGERSSGLGIGLALARRLAAMHGGTLEAASEGPGKGAEFTVRLPLASESPQASAVAAVAGAGAPLGGKRILVVDDNRDAADSLAAMLAALGASVRAVHDGPTALHAFDAFGPDLVLLDIGMPGMDGHQVARAIRGREAGGRVPLVAITGWGQEEDRRRAHEAGFDHHLVKPADVARLLDLVASLDRPASASPPPAIATLPTVSPGTR